MVRLEVIEMAEPEATDLAKLKAYAAVSDDGQDSVLMMALRRAFDVVQRNADVALLPGRFRICAEDHPGIVNVYMGGKVQAVTDGNGLAHSFNQRGRTVSVGTDGYFEIEFTTEVNAADYDRLLPVVMRYATAIYDGEDTKVLNDILKEVLYA